MRVDRSDIEVSQRVAGVFRHSASRECNNIRERAGIKYQRQQSGLFRNMKVSRTRNVKCSSGCRRTAFSELHQMCNGPPLNVIDREALKFAVSNVKVDFGMGFV